MTWQTVFDTVLDDLELQAGIIITPQQLNTLQRTHELRFKATDLKPYNVAGMRQYLHNTPAKRCAWQCYQDLATDDYVITLQTPA